MTDPNISDEPPFVRELLQKLRDADFNVNEGRFPFTYHHDFVREWIATSDSRTDAAEELDRDFRQKLGLQVYYAEACLGAVAWLIAGQPGTVLKAILHEGQDHWLTDAIRNLQHLVPRGKSKFV